MVEFVLFVWLMVPGQAAEVVEVGTYNQLARCEEARDTFGEAREGVSFVAMCISRDK